MHFHNRDMSGPRVAQLHSAKVPRFCIAHARYKQMDRRTDGKAISISEHLARNARYKHSVREV